MFLFTKKRFFSKFINMLQNGDIVLEPAQLSTFYRSDFPYFGTLSSQYQNIFLERCLQFISEKEIIVGEKFDLSNKSIALIAASAVQLTIGLNTWNLSYFTKIIVYPSDFESNPNGLMYRGETNLNGFIKLSWASFIHGYKTSDDNINLGLHEFSHALRFNSIRGHTQDYFVEHYFCAWLAEANQAYYDLRNNRQSIFRKYGGTNINEFISVCIEHYFESPDEIKCTYPKLYYATAILLNQKTDGAVTKIDIRQNMFEQKNSLHPGFSHHAFRSYFRQTQVLRTYIIALISVLYGIAIAVASNLEFFTLGFFITVYLIFDFRFTKIYFNKLGFVVEKGLFIFKQRKSKLFSLSQLISVRALTNHSLNDYWHIIFYDTFDGYFYSEKVYSHKVDNNVFVKELLSNKIAYYK